ncbi:MAG: hypothetical protein RR837_11210, partial [Bacteroidales bacterium]
MKRFTLLAALLFLCVGLSFGQSEISRLQSFLQQPSADGVTNAEKLGITDLNNPATMAGVVWNGNNVTGINWSGKKLAGELNLSGFEFLQNVNISKNSITA